MSQTYILFKKVPKVVAPKNSLGGWIIFGGEEVIPMSPEENKNTTPAEEIYEFVCESHDPAIIAKAVRAAPLEKYFLFEGTIKPIKVAIPVFVDGKNLDNLNDEWA